MKTAIYLFQILFLSLIFFQCSHEEGVKVELSAPTIDMVSITGGPWYDAMELERQYLRSLDPDRLLYHFKKTAGLESDAKEYGGWELGTRELRGHSLGHYLSAISRMARLTNDSTLYARCFYIVKELNRCQSNMGTGYVSAFPEEYLDRLENLEEVWAPYYTIHKILAGLFDCYVYCGDSLALTTTIDYVHYIYSRTKPLGMEHFQKALYLTEQGGMNEVLWDIYAATGDTISRDLAPYFYQNTYFEPLEQGRENLKGWHTNAFIPSIVGAAIEYEATGDVKKRQVSELFWRQVIDGRTFVTGGTSSNDGWNADPNQLHLELSHHAQECCCTYNMLKLSSHLWGWSKDIKYQDYIEKGLTNSILPSQNPITGMSTYHLPTAPGYNRTWSTPDSSFWCCTGTGMENFSRIAEYIYAVEDNCLYINQFVPSELNYEKEGFKLIQETTMPDGKELNIKVICDKLLNMKLAIRIPSWTSDDYTVKLNGKTIESKSAADSYLMLERVWHSGDKIDISFVPQLWYSLLPTTNNNVAFGYGPLVLVGAFDGEKDEKPRSLFEPYNGPKVDVPNIAFNSKIFPENIEVTDAKNLFFKMKSQSGDDIKLMPLYKTINEHFAIYLPIDSTKNTIINRKHDPTKQQKKQEK